MRSLLVVLLLAACSRPAPQPPTPVEPVEYLLDSAAADFRAHPPRPDGFRGVRAGYLTENGAKHYRMCGEFSKDGTWTRFATLQTSKYEQWIGGDEHTYCKPEMTWSDRGDLSAELQRRFDAAK